MEAALDSLTQVLGTDCSWIQLAKPVNNELKLISSRNFTHEIHHEMSQMDINHYFVKEVVGLGNRVIIPNLSMDGSYGMAVFEKAGFYSLVAVPITTHKILGIIGAAYKSRKRFSNDFPQLLAVIANLIGMALKKNVIAENKIPPEDSLKSSSELRMKTNSKAEDKEGSAIIEQKTGVNCIRQVEDEPEAFQEHVRIMNAFRKSHK
ncbi:GAF domain-containing protein [Chloroflexota bacterium]